MKKKFLALVLTLAMVLSLVPATALATNGTSDTTTKDVVYGHYTNTGEWKSGELENAIPDWLKDTVTTVDKTAKKVDGQDNQYDVTLKVQMKQKKTDVPPGAAATVLVIDTSGSMNDCTKEEHKHTDDCYQWEKCTPQVNPRHYRSDGSHKKYNTKCKYEDGRYIYPASQTCGKEEHEHNSDNCKAPYRIDATKEAAENFLKSYRGGTVSNGNWVPSTTSLKRYVSIVSFNIGASKSDWVDVSTKKGYDKAIASINDLSANGGTNLDAGLRMANAQLGDSKVTSMPANVVVLTDGKPTFYLGDQEYIDGDYYYWPDIRWVTVGEITYRVHGKGSQCNDATYTTTVSTAKALKQAASVYTVCFGASNEKLEAKDKPTVSEFLKTKIATKQAEGKKYAYDANNATELYKAFAAISSSVVSGLNTGTVEDALPAGVSCTQDGIFDDNRTLTWELDPGQATKGDPDDNGFITYKYEKQYTVKIDPAAEGLNVEDGYVPLNLPTTLTVQNGGEEVKIPFPIPAGKVTATITFKSETGGTIGDNKTEISGSYASGSDFPTIPATTANDGYTFDGWYDKDDNKVETFPATVTGSATYTAKWTKDTAPPELDSTDVYVYFQTQNTKGEAVNISEPSIKYNEHSWATLGKISTTQTLTSGTEYTGTNDTLVAVGAQAKTDLKDNALYSGNKDIAAKVLPSITWVSLKESNGADGYQPATEECWHLNGKLTVYGVTYLPGVKAGTEVTNMPENPQTSYLKDTTYTVNSNVPQRTGYTFAGWKSSEGGTVYQTGGDMQFTMPAKDVTLTAQWTPNNGTKYQVEHYQQQLDGTTYELKETDTLSGNTGDSVTAQFKTTYTGFTYDETVTGTVKSGTIAADGSLVLKLYYTRNSYNVTYQYEGTAPDGAPDVNALSGTHKYGAEVTVDTKVSADAVAGYTFSGWSTDDVTVTDGKFTMPATNVTLKGKFEEKTNPLTYTINQHFMDGEGKEIPSLYAPGESQTANKDTLLSDLIKDKAVNRTNENKSYVYVSSKTTYTVGEEVKSLETTSKLTENTTIDLYYYLDVIGGKDENGNLIDKGDEIPDCYQVTIIYKSSDESRGKISDASPKKEVLTITDKEGNRLSSGKVEITGASAEVTGSRCYFSNWTNDDNQQIANSATLEARTIDAKGGDVYTFTANFGRSSGGSNRPKPPVVEIPDDVPTGLNGKDHYAYVVGYPDGMVYPQKNITRAEVATIFFRLLKDETREANMTKSNGYNDMKDGAWYTCAVSTLSKMGIIKGYEDGSFKPDASISRAEFAAIAARFDPDGDKTPATFSDVSSHWAKDEISIAANHGWIKGYEDGSFKPDQKITRAETMTLVNRVLKRLPETKDDLHKDMKTWPDNQNESAWFYLAVQEATNSHYQKLKKDGIHETWESMRETRDWAALEK